MKKTFNIIYIIICMLCLVTEVFAQQTGNEQIVSKNIYKGDFTVAGDKDAYYPAVRRLLPSYGRNAAFSRSIKVLKLRVRKELRGL